MVVLTWIYGQNKLVKFTLPLPWNDLNPGQRPSDMGFEAWPYIKLPPHMAGDTEGSPD